MSRLCIPIFVLAVAAGPLAAQQPPTVPPQFDAYRSAVTTALRMYNDPAIQAELKLTDEQKEKLKKIPDDLLAKHKDAIAKEQNASKEATEKAAAERVERVKKFEALIEKNLTAEQQKRLNQLAVRSMGLSAFFDTEVDKALGLTDESRTKLNEIQQAGFERLRKEFPNYSPFNTDAETQKKYNDAQLKRNQDVFDQCVATFTADQKKAWKELTGEPSEAITTTRGRFSNVFDFRSSNAYKHSLLASEQVLTELKVEKAAREALADGLKAITPDPRIGSGPGGAPLGRPGASVQATLRNDAAAMAAEVLTPPQTKRLEQVNFQLRGVNVFSSSPVFSGQDGPRGTLFVSSPVSNPLAKLTLTPAQVVKIDDVMNDLPKKQAEVPWVGFVGSRIPPDKQTDEEKARLEESRKAQEEYMRKMNEIDQKALADITGTFDAGQKRVWKELTGELFDTTMMRGGGPIGGGGPARTSIIVLWTRDASRLMRAGEYAAALAMYDEAIRLAPSNVSSLMQKASLLASCPSDWVRDGKQAVELMTKAIAETKEPSYTQYDVLAMAHAEAGQFDDAVKAQQKAIEMMPKPAENAPPQSAAVQQKPLFEERLKLYQEKKPYRVAPPSFAPPGGGR